MTTDSLLTLSARYPGLTLVGIGLVKATAILSLASSLAFLLRSRSAAARVWGWRSAFSALILVIVWPHRPAIMGEVTLELRVAGLARRQLEHSSTGRLAVPARANAPIHGAAHEATGVAPEKAPDTSITRRLDLAMRVVESWVLHVWWLVSAALLVVLVCRNAAGVRRWRATSREAPARTRAAAAEIATRSGIRFMPAVRVSSAVRSPVLTCGMRCVIWLPEESDGWSSQKLDVVLRHEVAHLSRLDGWWQWLALAGACLWWWNPAVWRALRHLRTETELAADDAVLQGRVAPADYAQALVEIASGWPAKMRARHGVPMLGLSVTEHRVRELLRENPWRGRVGGLASTALALCAALMASIVLISCKQQPPRHVSFGKLIAAPASAPPRWDAIAYRERLQDFYGTIIETLEGAEMRRCALDRVRALHPEVKGCDVEISVRQNNGTSLFDVSALGAEPKYVQTYLDALLDEFIAFRESVRAGASPKALNTLAEDLLSREKRIGEMVGRIEIFEKANNIAKIQLTNDSSAIRLAQATTEKREREARVADLERALADVPAALDEVERTRPASFTKIEADYQQNRVAMVKLRAERDRLDPDKASDSTRRGELDGEMGTLQMLIEAEEKQIAESLRRSIVVEQAKLKALTGEIEAATQEAVDAGSKLAQHESLRSNLEEMRKGKNELFGLVRQFQTNFVANDDNVMIMERASPAVLETKKGWFW